MVGRFLRVLWRGLFAACAVTCANLANAGNPVAPPASSLDRASEDRILALNPERVSERDVKDLLSSAPAPRILSFQGALIGLSMTPFAEFLIAMGYPADRLRNPRDGTYTYSSYVESAQVAGALASHYEREGMMPMLIGHSRGGLVVIRVLYDLAGADAERIPVWNPLTDEAEGRFTVRDPISGVDRPVVGLRIPFATAFATGKLMRVLQLQWKDLPRLREIPDSVEEFTGFQIE